MCHYHFEMYFGSHEVDVKNVVRLSDNDRDFSPHAEPGKPRQARRIDREQERQQECKSLRREPAVMDGAGSVPVNG